jgi:hypothetical protein
MAAYVKYNCFVKDLAEKKHDFSADVFKIALTNRAPVVATDAVLADITELGATNGYTAGGNTATVNSSTQSGGVYKSVLNDPAAWTASGGALGPFRYAVFYNSSSGNRLIGYHDYGSAITLQVGETFTDDLDQVNGLFTIT